MNGVCRAKGAKEWAAPTGHIRYIIGFIIYLRVGFYGWGQLIIREIQQLVVQGRNIIELIYEVMGKQITTR